MRLQRGAAAAAPYVPLVEPLHATWPAARTAPPVRNHSGHLHIHTPTLPNLFSLLRVAKVRCVHALQAAQASFQGDLLRGGPAAAALRHGTPPPSQPATGSGPVGTPPRQSPTANGFAMADGSPAGPVAQPAAGAGAAGAGAAGQAGGPGPGQGQGHDGEASGAAGRSKRLRT